MNWIKECRELKGVTQEQLAKELGFSRTLVSKWETGTATVTIENTKILCDYFGIKYEEVMNPLHVDQLIAKRKKGTKIDLLMTIFSGLLVIGTILYAIIAYSFGRQLDLSDKVFLCIDPFLLVFTGWYSCKSLISLKDERFLLIGYIKNKVPKDEGDELYKMNFNELRGKLRGLIVEQKQ